ncbi:host attachment protein [Aquibaculum arenosum]|uniref:Host attachment protein n=1 Tax=Aquibaculum arenosum TaxID=3032591 RepID=A0ABT5YNH4_9PROT|nr:host attachment protein [Fodinicurvata sp. CAU 1616]MDF2096523.1 host attachment protein [Fodinicurvata sp. CAU 1616]
MLRRGTTWLLVADGARARTFSRQEPSKRLSELDEGSFTGNRSHSRDLGNERPGRTHDSAGPGRHAMEPPSDPHDLAEQSFLREVVEWLEEKEKSGAFDQLIVVAAPRALGELRRLFSKSLSARILAELDSDLTHADAREVETRTEAL